MNETCFQSSFNIYYISTLEYFHLPSLILLLLTYCFTTEREFFLLSMWRFYLLILLFIIYSLTDC